MLVIIKHMGEDMTQALRQFSEQTARWFEQRVGQPTPVQTEGWPVIASGQHALISAPTGTGKTLAAFLVFVDELAQRAQAGDLKDELQVLYISPLKALGNDIRENLRRPIEDIPCPGVRALVRTGDTDAGERRDMLKRPPHILITTPESLFLLLTAKGGRGMLKSVKTVIVDELHAMIGTKRGAHLMLSLSRLDALCGHPVQRIALSATIRPLERAARYLAKEAPVQIVAPRMEKSSDILVESVVPDMRQLPEGSIWPEIARAVVDECQSARTVIAFMEGRAQSEKLAHLVNAIAGAGFARTHHGCVSKEQRLEAERQLKSGQLRLLCATSSMELGIDVGEVDKVLQIGCPFSVSGALQRLGRAGHNPGRTSVMRIFPRMASEIVTAGMTATSALCAGIEPASPPENCLDILAQHLVSMAAEGVYPVERILQIITSAHSFRGVTMEDLESVLRMLSGDYEHAQDRPARPRLIYDRIHSVVGGDPYSRMLAVSSGGTIPDRGWFPVFLADGTRLGELDEEMVFESRVGDRFLLGAFGWRMVEIRKDRVIAAPAAPEGARIPFWHGDGGGRAYEVGLQFGAYMRGLNEAQAAGRLSERLLTLHMDAAAASNAARHLQRQFELTGQLPDDRTIILEHFSDEAGERQLMVHSVFGRRLNAALEMLMRHEANRLTGQDVQSYTDDDGFLLYLSTRAVPEGLMSVLDPLRAREIIRAMLPATPLFQMSFRYNANRSLMMGVRKGGRVPLWVQRVRGAEALQDAARDMDHPLMRETLRECMHDYMDLDALDQVLSRLRAGEIAVHEIHTPSPSPMALPLRRQVEATMMYEYFPTPTAAIHASEQALAATETIVPDGALLEAPVYRPQPKDAERLHAMLMAEGDLIAGEVEAPVDWLTGLANTGRALYIEPGLWIAGEQAELYRQALEDMDFEARKRIVRRLLRYRGGQTPESLTERYLISEDDGERMLQALVSEGVAAPHDGVFYHRELYQRAVRETVYLRRQVETRPGSAFARMLAGRARFVGGARDQLRLAMPGLLDLPYPIEAWEGVLLPARASGYRPALLDELLSEGQVFWRMADGKLSFHSAEDIDWDGELPLDDIDLSDDERALLKALRARGASFAHALSPLIGGRSALDALMELMKKGLVRADSFAPVRLHLEQSAIKPGKRRARARVNVQAAGRWELLRPQVRKSPGQLLERAFARCGLLCRETCEGQRFGYALELLRVWEYTGRARRGYFVRGLSGAQFILSADYERSLAQMAAESPEVLWLNATDPAQAWGRFLPHEEGRSFLLVPGTVVALRNGEPVAVLERGGECLRVFDAAALASALEALARQFELGRVYPGTSRITIKKYPESAPEALTQAGFVREMMDYSLWRRAF